MTQPVQTPYQDFSLNGSDTEFEVTAFDIEYVSGAASMVKAKIILNGEETELTQPADYTVALGTLSSDGLVYDGCTVTTAAAYDEGTLRIYRETPLSMDVSLTQSGNLNPPAIEGNGLDRLTRILQEFKAAMAEFIRVVPGEEGFEIDSPVDNDGKYLVSDGVKWAATSLVELGTLILTGIAPGRVAFGGASATELQFISSFVVDPNTGIVSMTGLSTPNVEATDANISDNTIMGDPGTEGSGINVGGVTYDSTAKITDINGPKLAQTIHHKHSTTFGPVMVFARSNSDTTAHADVTNSQSLGAIYICGWAGSNYKIFGILDFIVNATGTISNTSAPGAMVLSLTPNGSVTPVEVLRVAADGAVTLTGSLTVGGSVIGPSTPRILARTTGLVLIQNTAAETTVLSFTLAGGTLGTNRAVRIKVYGKYETNGVSRGATVRMKLGATTVIAEGLAGIDIGAGNPEGFVLEFILRADNSAASQFGTLSGVYEAPASTNNPVMDIGSGAENTASDLTLAVTWQWTAAAMGTFANIAAEAELI